MTRRTVLVWVCALLVVLGGLAGCASAAEKAAEDATGVEIETDDGSVSVETDDGSVTVDEEGVELPAGFPSDVPVYDGTITTAWEDAEGGGYQFAISTADSVPDVIDWYKGKLTDAGWTVSASSADDTSGMISASNASFDLYLGAGGGDGTTDISQSVNAK